jgi:hypothetical protein
MMTPHPFWAQKTDDAARAKIIERQKQGAMAQLKSLGDIYATNKEARLLRKMAGIAERKPQAVTAEVSEAAGPAKAKGRGRPTAPKQTPVLEVKPEPEQTPFHVYPMHMGTVVQPWVAKPVQHNTVDWTKVWPYSEISYAKPLWKQIAEEVCLKHRITWTELHSKQRQPRIVACRHEVFYRLKKEVAMSLPDIGRLIGGRDHTTVLHGVRMHEQRVLGVQAEVA